MSEIERLKKRLVDMKVTNFGVFKGEGWNEATPEERAASLNKIFDAIEDGDFIEAKHMDGFINFQIPVEDFRDKTAKYYLWKVLDRVDRVLVKVYDSSRWKIHRLKRWRKKKFGK